MENYKKVARWHENVLPSPETDAHQGGVRRAGRGEEEGDR